MCKHDDNDDDDVFTVGFFSCGMMLMEKQLTGARYAEEWHDIDIANAISVSPFILSMSIVTIKGAFYGRYSSL